jgi:hypothetical protein
VDELALDDSRNCSRARRRDDRGEGKLVFGGVSPLAIGDRTRGRRRARLTESRERTIRERSGKDRSRPAAEYKGGRRFSPA